jgi:TonB family protein
MLSAVKFKESPYFILSLVLHGLLVVTFYNTSLKNISLSSVKKSINRPATITTELSLEKKEEIKKEVKKLEKKIIQEPSPIAKQIEPQEETKEQVKETPKASTYVADLSKNLAHDQTPEELRAFFTNLIEEIHKKKRYPTLSKRLRESGVVHVKFEVSPDGQVRNAILKKPCTYKRLNTSALQVVSNLKIKELPPENYGKIEITFPMDYVL